MTVLAGNGAARSRWIVGSMIMLLAMTALARLWAAPEPARVEPYTVGDGDTMYWISRSVYSDAERDAVAHWLAIFACNVARGSIDPARTPIQHGPKDLFLHIE